MGLITETSQAYYAGNNQGGYQYVSLQSIVNNFLILFTGEGKVIPKGNRTEVMMHAKRGIQEFSYDVFKSYKGLEVELPPSLTIPLPQDYVSWVKISWIDGSGVKREIQPIRITSNPKSIVQDSNLDYTFDGEGELEYKDNSVAWDRVKSASEVETVYEEPDCSAGNSGRIGLDPEFATANGGWYIDELTGLIHFTSVLSGKIIHIDYISDGLAYDSDLVVHKFAEDAIYKYILYAIIAVTMGSQEYLVRRYKRSFVAARRKAKLRISKFNAYVVQQWMRGKSKQIKH